MMKKQVKKYLLKLAVVAVFSVTTISAAFADVCFLPSGGCQDDYMPAVGACDGYSPQKKTGPGWICESCPADPNLWKCYPKECPSGYSPLVNACPQGYSLKKDGYSGDEECGACVKTDCPSGMTINDNECPAEHKPIATEYFSGGYVCYRCVSDMCPTGMVKECPEGDRATYQTDTPFGTPCYTCQSPCDDECTIGAKNIGYCPQGYSKVTVGHTDCGTTCSQCEEAKCEEGYSTSVTECPADYDKVCSGYSGEQACCKCSKPCLYTETEDKTALGYTCDSCERGGVTYYSCKCNKEFERPNDASGIVKCYDCEDENDKFNPCYGKYHCKGGGRLPVGDVTCTCPYRNMEGEKVEGVNYYEMCLIRETCLENVVTEANGGRCVTYEEGSAMAQYGAVYKVRVNCQRITSNNYVNDYATCATDDSKDCMGNYSPVRGMTKCPNDKGVNGKQCGNEWYFSSCEETCNAGDTLKDKGGVCSAFDESEEMDKYSSYYFVKDKCSRVTSSSKVKYYANCSTGDEKDCLGNYSPVRGKKKCPNDKGTGGVKCGNDWYFNSCDETCQEGDTITENGGKCTSYDETSAMANYGGLYAVRTKCQRTTSNSSVKYYALCTTSDTLDCNGGYSPVRGLKKCKLPNIYPWGRTVKCGNETYAEECYSQCNYNYDEEYCTSIGKKFVRKCGDEKGHSWGECE